GEKIVKVIAEHSPHKFAWFHGDPQTYHSILAGKTIGTATGYGGMVEIKVGSVGPERGVTKMVFGDGVGLRYLGPGEVRPEKHQLMVEFENSGALTASVQMYGGIWCFQGAFDNPYYKVAQEKPSPLSSEFNEAWFEGMLAAPEHQKLSAKAFLATEQRVPGLGNGVLQDILWNARIHPKRKMNTLAAVEKEQLFKSVKVVLMEMTKLGARDTEKDLFGKNGGYQTVMSKNNAGLPCPVCSEIIKKENYLGGSIYYCPGCQRG
ncbi:MAG TPA: endonuclease VIII, partial [Bacillota bacterium]|nr:endonuclease VIII [Bacillota bacterium]